MCVVSKEWLVEVGGGRRSYGWKNSKLSIAKQRNYKRVILGGDKGH